MNYLIIFTHDGKREVWYTNWFDAENNFAAGMQVINLLTHLYTEDGINWFEIPEDHL